MMDPLGIYTFDFEALLDTHGDAEERPLLPLFGGHGVQLPGPTGRGHDEVANAVRRFRHLECPSLICYEIIFISSVKVISEIVTFDDKYDFFAL